MSWKTINVDVDVDLSDFDTDDLIEELQSRGKEPTLNDNLLIRKIYENRRMGKDYQADLDALIYNTIGKII